MRVEIEDIISEEPGCRQSNIISNQRLPSNGANDVPCKDNFIEYFVVKDILPRSVLFSRGFRK
jgi:hypothetical protein